MEEGEEQVVKKRMSCLMGCQECNSIIMKSDSLDGRMAEWPPRRAVGLLYMPQHPHPQVSTAVFDLEGIQPTVKSPLKNKDMKLYKHIHQSLIRKADLQSGIGIQNSQNYDSN